MFSAWSVGSRFPNAEIRPFRVVPMQALPSLLMRRSTH